MAEDGPRLRRGARRDAQAPGYAEADPSGDVEGDDAVNKLVDPGPARVRRLAGSGRRRDRRPPTARGRGPARHHRRRAPPTLRARRGPGVAIKLARDARAGATDGDRGRASCRPPSRPTAPFGPHDRGREPGRDRCGAARDRRVRRARRRRRGDVERGARRPASRSPEGWARPGPACRLPPGRSRRSSRSIAARRGRSATHGAPSRDRAESSDDARRSASAAAATSPAPSTRSMADRTMSPKPRRGRRPPEARRALRARSCRSPTRRPPLTLGEGATPLVHAPPPRRSARRSRTCTSRSRARTRRARSRTGAWSWRSRRRSRTGARAIICASTGNTSASAAAYGAAAGLEVVVVLPKGQIALGKLLQALVAGARVVAVDGNFDDALRDRPRARRAGRPPADARQLGQPVPARGPEDGARSRSATTSAGRPDILAIPVGNAGNISAYWAGVPRVRDGRPRRRDAARCSASRRPARRRSSRPAGRRARDDRDRDPDRQSGVVGRGDRGPRRERRPDRRGRPTTRSWPRTATLARLEGDVLRAVVGGQRGGRAQGSPRPARSTPTRSSSAS